MAKESTDTIKNIYVIVYFIFVIYNNIYLCNKKYNII